MPIFDSGEVSAWQASPGFNVTLAEALGIPQLSKSFSDFHSINPPNSLLDCHWLALRRLDGASVS
jgi:hypothetical protein